MKNRCFISNRTNVFILFFLFLFIGNSYADDHLSYVWKRVSYTDGLSNPRITAIMEDSKGTFWVGTRDGLNRIVGGAVRSYFHSNDACNAIPNNFVRRIVEDAQGQIWVLCVDGVAVYNAVSDNFTVIEYNGKPLNVQSIQETSDGILLGGHGIIYKYSYVDKQLSLFYEFEPHMKFGINHILVLDDRRFLLLNYIRGGYMLDVYNHSCVKIFEDEEHICPWGAIIDSKKRLWIPVYNNGVRRIHYDGDGNFSDYQRFYHQDLSYRSLSVISMLETSSGEILAGSDGGGIWRYDSVHQGFEEKQELQKIYHMPLTSVTALLEDNCNNIWAGTVRAGVVIMKKTALKHFELNDNCYMLSTLFTDEESDNRIWLGMDSGGLYEFDKQENTFKEIAQTTTKKIVSIVRYSPHQLLLSSYDDGLYLFDTSLSTLCRYPIDEDLFKILYASQSVTHLVKKKQIIRLLTWNKMYELTSMGISRIKGFSNASEQIIPIRCNGDFAYGIQGSRLINFFAQNALDTLIYTNDLPILAACARSQDELFIADRFSLKQVKSGKMKIIASLSSIVQYLIYDKQNRIWAFASDGIYCYDLCTKRMTILSYQANPVLCQTALCDADGDIFWGGLSNFSCIFHDIDLPDSVSGSVVPLKLSIDNEALTDWENLSFPYDFTRLKLLFNIRGKDVLAKTKDMFLLEGINDVKLESIDNELNIYTLPSGEYSLKYVFIDGSGNTREEKVFDFVVQKPWWFSNMSLAVYSLLVFISISLFVYFQNRKREREFFWSLKEHEKQMSDEKVRFLINISHELRTPLTLIYGPIKDMLIKEHLPQNEMIRLKKVLFQVKKMTSLINTILNTRKSEMQGEELNIEKTDLNGWIQDVCGEFIFELEARGLELKFDLDASNPQLFLDRKKCEIVLSNILMNAMKYGSLGKYIIVKTHCNEHSVRVSVEDHGEGIPEEKIENLFNRFYQGKEGSDGFGIGLSYAKMLVEMHHGMIGASNNEDGGGATFFFELPLLLQTECVVKTYFDTESKIDYHYMVTSEQFLGKKYSVLIVDDDLEIIEFVTEQLKPYFKHLYSAKNGMEALFLAKKKLPDIIVSDVMMPKMDGFELCKAIKTDLEIGHIPVILLTARADNQSREIGYKMGADNYLDKPFDIETLRSVVFSELCNREIAKNRYKNTPNLIASEELTFSHADEDFIRKLNQYIIENISDEKLSVEMISRHMEVSRSLLHNKMKAILDTNISNYLKNMRIQKSKELLERSELSLVEVAFECGFSSQAYFSTVFKNCTGLSPLTYRKQFTIEKVRK